MKVSVETPLFARNGFTLPERSCVSSKLTVTRSRPFARYLFCSATRFGNSSMITGTASDAAVPRPSRASITPDQLSKASDVGSVA